MIPLYEILNTPFSDKQYCILSSFNYVSQYEEVTSWSFEQVRVWHYYLSNNETLCPDLYGGISKSILK